MAIKFIATVRKLPVILDVIFDIGFPLFEDGSTIAERFPHNLSVQSALSHHVEDLNDQVHGRAGLPVLLDLCNR